jgi:hypothetical protein
MRLRGVVRTAELQEVPPGSGRIEIALSVQGVGPGQPRALVIPFERLLEDESLDPEVIRGRGFEAEVENDDQGRWIVVRIAFASMVLRPEG